LLESKILDTGSTLIHVGAKYGAIATVLSSPDDFNLIFVFDLE